MASEISVHGQQAPLILSWGRKRRESAEATHPMKAWKQEEKKQGTRDNI